MNVFLDTNVVIDFMGKRNGFFNDAAIIFSMIKEKIINASISSLTVVNCAYILNKAFDKKDVLKKIDGLCKILNIMPINNQVLKDAINLQPTDYEDAVQYISSLPFNPDVIITRDKKGFADFNIIVMTPDEFVRIVKS